MSESDLVSSARRQRTSRVVALAEFLRIRAAKPTVAIAAVEGKDDIGVWSIWVKRAGFDQSIEFLPCGNKDKVLKLRDAIEKNTTLTSQNVAYIVDRDYDDLGKYSPMPNTFLTDRYSIENYFISENVIEYIFNTKFACAGQCSERESLLQLFSSTFKQYKNASWELHVKTYCMRKLSTATRESLPRKFAQIVDVKSPYEFKESREHGISIPAECCATQIQMLTQEFSQLEFECRARGKYHKLFMAHFFKSLQAEKDVSKRENFPSSRIESDFKYSDLNLNECAGISPLPVGFPQFLQANLS